MYRKRMAWAVGLVVLSIGCLCRQVYPIDIVDSVARVRVDNLGGSEAPSEFGEDWGEDAYKYLQDALEDIDNLFTIYEESVDRVEIWVREGEYYPDQRAGEDSDDPAESFHLRQNVQILGGFDGSEEDRIERDAHGNETVLSGWLGEEASDNSLNVVAAGDLEVNTRTAQLNGFTVKDGVDISHSGGGGIWIDSSDPVIANCRVTENQGKDGGGVWIVDYNTVGAVFVNCIIDNNLNPYIESIERHGAGIYAEDALLTFHIASS